MSAILLLPLAFVIVLFVKLFAMARAQTERQSEFLTTPRDQSCRTDSALPITGLTYATRLRQYRLVEDNPADANRRTIRHATDGSLHVRGILSADQQTYNDGSQTMDEVNPLTYVTDGPARLEFEAAIAKHTRFVAGTAGRARAYNPAGGDTINMVLGRTECQGTAANDILDVRLDISFNGA